MDYLILIERGTRPFQDSEIWIGPDNQTWEDYEKIMEEDQRETGFDSYTITRFLGEMTEDYYNLKETDFIQSYYF